jgi:small subunit ribosomal protein S10e
MVHNLKVMMIMKSLKSKNFVSEIFSWQHLYYCINAEGVEHLKEFLGLKGQNIKPETFKKRAGKKEIGKPPPSP